eukprot:5202865-Prymnesium_polylepis.1
MSAGDFEREWRRIDANGDGLLQFSELCAFYGVAPEGVEAGARARRRMSDEMLLEALMMQAELESAATAFERRLTLSMHTGAEPRGRHVLMLPTAPPPPGDYAHCYVLVSKADTFATRDGAHITWAFTCACPPRDHDGAAPLIRVVVETHSWPWAAERACISYGFVGEASELPPPTDPEAAQIGCTFAIVAPPAGKPPEEPCVAFEFVPESAELSTATLRNACSQYYAAFANLNGDLLSAIDETTLPPPRWEDATGAVVVDSSYASL